MFNSMDSPIGIALILGAVVFAYVIYLFFI